MGVNTNFRSKWGYFSTAQEVDNIIEMTNDEIDKLYQLYKEYRACTYTPWNLEALPLIRHINWLFSGDNLEPRTIGSDERILRKYCEGRNEDKYVKNLLYVTFTKPLWNKQVHQLYELLKMYVFLVRANSKMIIDEKLIVNIIGVMIQDIIVKAKAILEKLARGLGVYKRRFDDMIFGILDFADRELPGSLEEKFMGVERNFFVLVEVIWTIRNVAVHDSAYEINFKAEREEWETMPTGKISEKRVVLIKLELKKPVSEYLHRIPEKYRVFLDLYGHTFFKHVKSEIKGIATIKEYVDRLIETSKTLVADLHWFIEGVETLVDFLVSRIAWSLKRKINNNSASSK